MDYSLKNDQIMSDIIYLHHVSQSESSGGSVCFKNTCLLKAIVVLYVLLHCLHFCFLRVFNPDSAVFLAVNKNGDIKK